MISTILKCGAILAAVVAIIAGLFLTTSIPTKLGVYRLWASYEPMLIGFTPAFMYGEEWKYTWEEFYSPETKSYVKGQSAIVTGANSGIGFDLAMALAKNGADVTITCRSQSKCDNAKKEIDNTSGEDGGTVSTMLLDTASFSSVRKFAETYVQTFPNKSIDMFFMNAGTGILPSNNPQCAPKTDENGIEYLFQVSYLSHHLLYRLLELYLSPTAGIIHTSSSAAYRSYSYKVATDLETLHGCSEPYVSSSSNLSYGQSKLAQDVWSKAVTRHLGDSSTISVNAFHPGMVNTQIWENSKKNRGLELDKKAKEAVSFLETLEKYVLPYAWQSPDGALTGLYLATHPEIKGKFYHPQAQEVVNHLALDEELQDKLWKFSEELVKEYVTPPIVVPEPTKATNQEDGINEE